MKISKLLLPLIFCTFVLPLFAKVSHTSNVCILTQRQYLSGTGSDDTKQWDFYCSAGNNSGKWKKIAVPSCWEQQGFGEYTYGRFYKIKGKKPSNETGHYRTKFSVPHDWKGQYIRLTFEGVMTDATVYIDGKQVGATHQGGFMEFSYDVTSFIVPGKRHLLEVKVSKESTNKSVNSAERRADWWLFGGIYRPVYIEAMPKEHIDDVSIDARANGDLYVMFPHNDVNMSKDITFTLDGRTIKYDEKSGCYHCGKVNTWNPEQPNLYTATFTLNSSKHQIKKRIGFRTIEFRAHDGIYLNGTRLVVKGINRHCFHPETGRTTNKALSISDVKLIKSMNMNAVRCHYPSDRHFMDVCDSLGVLYMSEFPGWQTHYDDTTAAKLLPGFIQRDVNHPSVFIWSNGNEGGWNTSIDGMFTKLDPQHRKVVHPWSDFEGIDTHHYPAYQTGAYRLQNGQNVFMPTEFLHSKYDKGGGAALEDMWNHWTKSPLFAGAFIWAFVDEAVRRTDLNGVLDSDGGNGPDGIVDPYRQPEGSVSAIKDVWSPIHIEPFTVPYAEENDSASLRLLIENRWLFTNLQDCRLTYDIYKENGEEVDHGQVGLPKAAPGEREACVLPLRAGYRKGDILKITAYNPQGEEVNTWTKPIHHADEQQTVSNQNDVKVTFSDNGVIAEVYANGKEIPLNGGPLPVGMLANCYKHAARTEADGTQINTFWYKGGVDSIQWRQTVDGRLFMDAVILNDERGHGFGTNFLTSESGWQIGLTFNYPETVFTSASDKNKIKYLGRGPYRVWRNRQQGQQFGVWTKQYNNTVTGQYNSVTPPVYPEFKGYHADVRWMQFPDFRVTSLTEGLFVRLYTPEEAIDQTPGEMGGADEGKKKQERTMVKFPEGDISFLLSIPPMQSYKPLEQLGPSAQPDNIRIKAGDEGFHIRLIFQFNNNTNK